MLEDIKDHLNWFSAFILPETEFAHVRERLGLTPDLRCYTDENDHGVSIDDSGNGWGFRCVSALGVPVEYGPISIKKVVVLIRLLEARLVQSDEKEDTILECNDS